MERDTLLWNELVTSTIAYYTAYQNIYKWVFV